MGGGGAGSLTNLADGDNVGGRGVFYIQIGARGWEKSCTSRTFCLETRRAFDFADAPFDQKYFENLKSLFGKL